MIDCCEKREQERDAYVYKRVRVRVQVTIHRRYVCTRICVYIRTRAREQRLKKLEVREDENLHIA